MKRGNRRTEHLLRAAELWSATAAVTCGLAYPYDALRSAWRTALLHQFHDILPGSSIGWVHREAPGDVRDLERALTELIAAAQHGLAGDGSAPVVFNAAPIPVAGVPAGGAALAGRRGRRASASRSPDGAAVLESDRTIVTLAPDGTIVSIVDALRCRGGRRRAAGPQCCNCIRTTRRTGTPGTSTGTTGRASPTSWTCGRSS